MHLLAATASSVFIFIITSHEATAGSFSEHQAHSTQTMSPLVCVYVKICLCVGVCACVCLQRVNPC